LRELLVSPGFGTGSGCEWDSGLIEHTEMDEEYYRQQIKVLDERLALAGLRLSALLNEVLGRVSPQEFRH
jgi:hypothetical protein